MLSPQVHTATVTTIQNCCQLSVSATLISAEYNFVSEQSNWWPHMYTEMANLSITTLLISATCYLSCCLKTPGYKPTSGSLGTFKPGDIVAVSVRSTAELRRLQDGHGGWNLQMSGVGLTRWKDSIVTRIECMSVYNAFVRCFRFMAEFVGLGEVNHGPTLTVL